MKSHLLIFKEYIILVCKPWFLWLFIAGDLIGLIVSIIYNKFFIPQPVFLIIALIVFVYAGYKVYYNIIISIPDKFKPGIPKLDIALIEGNSYNYSYAKPRINSTQEKKKSQKIKKIEYDFMKIAGGEMPKAKIVLNVRIHNNGDIPLNILSINPWFERDRDAPYRFTIPSVIDNNNSMIYYPVTIKANDIITCMIDFSIWPEDLQTEAQIAVRIFNMNRNNINNKLEISVEVSNLNNEIKEFKNKFTISLRPLYDLLFNYWKISNKQEILKLLNINAE